MVRDPRAAARNGPRTAGVQPPCGFTLIETLIAGFVLALAAVGLAATLAHGGRFTDSPREEMAAWNGIRTAQAQIASTSYATAAATHHNQGFAVDGLDPVPGDTDGLPGEITFAYGPGGDARLYQVTVRVRWRGQQGDRTVESSFLMANVRGEEETPSSGYPPPTWPQGPTAWTYQEQPYEAVLNNDGTVNWDGTSGDYVLVGDTATEEDD